MRDETAHQFNSIGWLGQFLQCAAAVPSRVAPSIMAEPMAVQPGDAHRRAMAEAAPFGLSITRIVRPCADSRSNSWPGPDA
jgi:hypothetical protein